MNEEIEKKILYYQELFGLKNWKLELDFKTNITDGAAKTLADPRYYRASIQFSQAFKNDPTRWDEVIIHEMIHIVMALYDFFCDNMSKEGSDSLFFVARESAVAQLTTIFRRIQYGTTN